MELSETSIEKISESVTRQMESKRKIPSDKHDKHHEWIDRQLERDKELHEMRKSIIKSSIAWALPMAIGYVCYSVWLRMHGGL